VSITKQGAQGIRLNNSKVNIFYVDIKKKIDNTTYGVLTFMEGNNIINICKSSIEIESPATNTDSFIKKSNTSEGINKVYVEDFLNPDNIPYYTD
jgi:hypothetical protein